MDVVNGDDDRNNSNKIEWNQVNYQMVEMKNNKIARAKEKENASTQ